MSKFLAPIHTWLFNKIKLHEELEANLIDIYRKSFGEDINILVQRIYNKYGTPLENVPLETLIDTSNIHGWLQDKISLTETRQAAILTEVINKYGKKSIDLALGVYSSQGNYCGSDAKDKYDVGSAPNIYEALNNYILEGMPCDNVNSIAVKEENYLEWKTSKCLHKSYWNIVSGNTNIFYELRYNWVKSFVEAANENFTYDTTSIEKISMEPFINKIH